MPLLKTILSFLFILIGFISYPQSEFPAFGSFTANEIALKQCSFDPEAEAIVLLDKAFTYHDDQQHMITERRVRIKILSEKGLEQADIEIPFYHKDDFEFIGQVKAYTYNFTESGAPIVQEVEKRSIYTKKENNFYSIVKFAMPAVKPGSIIEYHYVSTMKHYGGLEEWKFQSDLPVLKSSYLLEIPPRIEFAYTIQKKNDMPVEVKPLPGEGRIYYEMNNVPALRFEPYMDAARDYIQKVNFQLAGVVASTGGKMEVNTTWKKTAYDLMTEKNFGSQLDKDLKIDEIKLIIALENSQQGKLRAIYDYVRKNIGWTGYESKYAFDGLKAVWDRKKGTSGEINLLLVNLLKSADIETYPVLVAERNFGKIDPNYPFLDKFNKTIAFAIADGKQFLLDASEENCPIGLTPYSILNTTGFLVDKKNFNLITINPGSKSYKNVITIKGSMDKKGVVAAEASVKSYDYARQMRLNAFKNNRGKFINDFFQKNYDGLTIDSFLVARAETDTVALEQGIQFRQQATETGDLILLNTNMFTGLEKNPFISSIRFTNVNFGYTYDIALEEKIKLPAGTKVDLPEAKSLSFSNDKIIVTKQVRFEEGELKTVIRFSQTLTLIPADSYKGLKDFYKSMIDMLNEPIVLRIVN